MLKKDPNTVPLLFREELFTSKKPLTIGYYDFDGFTEASPACQRVVREAKALLEGMGHKLVPWTPPNVAKAYKLLIGACFVDGGKFVLGEVDSDIAELRNEPFLGIFRLSKWLRKLLSRIVYPRRRILLQSLANNPSEVREIYADVMGYRKEFAQAWLAAGLDCIICPPNAVPALPLNLCQRVFEVFSYTLLYNVVDYPGGSVPFSAVTAEDEARMVHYAVVDRSSALVKEATSIGTIGLPLGLQVVSLPFQEEIVLRVMTEIENKLKEE